MKFLNMETLTPILLFRPHIQERREDLCKHSVETHGSLKTEIARSVRGLKLQGPRARDAMVEPYFMLENLVT